MCCVKFEFLGPDYQTSQLARQLGRHVTLALSIARPASDLRPRQPNRLTRVYSNDNDSSVSIAFNPIADPTLHHCRSKSLSYHIRSPPKPLSTISASLIHSDMADENTLADSGITIRSDSEQYSNSGPDDLSMSPSPPSTSSSPLILYSPPTFWSLARGAAINLFLPFVNGLMLGFGELFAHEAAFRLGWGGTKVCLFFFIYAWQSVCRQRGLPAGMAIAILWTGSTT